VPRESSSVQSLKGTAVSGAQFSNWCAVCCALLLTVPLGPSGCSSHSAPSSLPPPQVSVAPVLERDAVQWDEFSGRVAATAAVEIRARVSGYIERVVFVEGTEVKRGDVLFVIDQRPYRAELQRAEAALVRARTHLVFADSEVKRAERLFTSRAISEQERDQRVATANEAKADVLGAEAAVDTARLNLQYSEVRSPIDGRTGRALVTAGDLVDGQSRPTLLTTVVSLDPVYVDFEADEQSYLRYVEMVQRRERQSSRVSRTPVRIALADETAFSREGYVDFVDNTLNPATGTIRARAVVGNADHVLIPGLFARVQFLGSGTFHALLVDDKAILTDQDRKYVFVLDNKSLAQRRDVLIGGMIDGFRVVTHGLQRGDRVIVHGVQKVFMPGMKVSATPIHMGDPAPSPQLGSVPAKAGERAAS